MVREKGAYFTEPNFFVDGQLLKMQVLAAHIRLLLDAPEHLWKLIEGKEFLKATCLFFLARLIFHALKKENRDEDMREKFIQEINLLVGNEQPCKYGSLRC